jgi:hypothetical protein
MIFGAISQLVTAGQQNKQARDTKVPEWQQYQTSPYAKEMLGLARTRQNARMAGAGMYERNVFQNQANTMGSVGRNATDGATAISAAMASQASTNDALNNLQMAEAHNQMQMDGQLQQAQGVMMGEGDKMYNSAEMRRQEQLKRKDAFKMASQMNKATAFDGMDAAIGGVLGAGLGAGGFLSKK